MKDVTTNKPLRVSKDGAAGAYITVPVEQLDDVQNLLDGHNVDYTVEEEVISLNGGPEVAVVDLGRGVDADAVQALLDRAG
jgi:hypothetical protein